MNKLEQKIFVEFDTFEKFSQYVSKQDATRIAAKICLEVAEKAYRAGMVDMRHKVSLGGRIVTFEDFMISLVGPGLH